MNDADNASKQASSESTKKNKGVIKGRDVQVEINVSFEESGLGCEKIVTFNRNEVCQTCDGSGA